MNWPLTLVFAGHRLQLPGPGRYRLDAGIAGQTDVLLDAARSQWGPASTGWLPHAPALLENLPLWENILLAAQWHAPSPPDAIASRLGDWLRRLGHDDAQAAWLAQSPREATADDRQRAAWLRMLLLQPKVLFLEKEAWDIVQHDAGLAAIVDEALSGSALVTLDPAAPAGFTVLSLEDEAVAP